MINVDIFVPALDRSYNFNLDEEAGIRFLIDEIAELLCKQEHSSLAGEKENLLMGSLDRRMYFNSKYSLKEYSIKNGDTLILV